MIKIKLNEVKRKTTSDEYALDPTEKYVITYIRRLYVKWQMIWSNNCSAVIKEKAAIAVLDCRLEHIKNRPNLPLK